jgi:dTDP-4-amino-4,6-dideoxygalactose transaminase
VIGFNGINNHPMADGPTMHIPFIDLERQYRHIKSVLDNQIETVVHEFNFLKGKQVSQFEHAFSSYFTSSPEVISVASGTDALFAILKMLGVSAGDEVITPATSWISSAETITLCGATPVFADIDPVFFTVNPEVIERKLTKKTRAIVAVHLYGQAADMDALLRLCEKHKLYLIEDCAQSHLTSFNNQTVGLFGDAAAFSFYPTKNLGAYGDAGCVITRNKILADKIRRFSNHGALAKDDHLFEGINSRMDTLQAGILLAKLPHLQQWNDKRRKNARLYTEGLAGISEVETPLIRPASVHTFHIYAVKVKDRDNLRKYLEQNGIQTAIHYPVALPNLPAYRHLNHVPGEFPVANSLQDALLSLPVFAELTIEEIDYVCSKIRCFYKR